jgi:ABC-type antimicrobial peptide transport system permease subunit
LKINRKGSFWLVVVIAGLAVLFLMYRTARDRARSYLPIPLAIDFLPSALEWRPVFLASFCSLLVGIVFGVYPGRKAAHYDPIVSFRYE